MTIKLDSILAFEQPGYSETEAVTEPLAFEQPGYGGVEALTEPVAFEQPGYSETEAVTEPLALEQPGYPVSKVQEVEGGNQDIVVKLAIGFVQPTVKITTVAAIFPVRSFYSLKYNQLEPVRKSNEISYGKTNSYSHTINYSGTVTTQAQNQAEWAVTKGDPVTTSHAVRYFQSVAIGHEAGYQSAQIAKADHAIGYEQTGMAKAGHAIDYQQAGIAKADHAIGYEQTGMAKAGHAVEYETAILAKLGHGFLYSPATELTVGHASEYETAKSVGVQHETEYGTTARINLEHATDYRGRYAAISNHQAQWSINQRNAARAGHVAPWYGDLMGIYVPAPSVEVRHGLSRIEAGVVEITSDEQSVGWMVNIEILEYAQYQRIQRGDEMVVTVDGETWALRVSHKALRKEYRQTQMEVVATSPVAMLGDEQFEGDFAGWTARDAVEHLIGETYWHTVDWVLTPSAVFYSTTRLDAAKAIVREAGGVIQSEPNGSVIIRHTYPDKIDQLGGAFIAHRISGTENLLEASELIGSYTEINRVIVTTERESGASRHDYKVIKETPTTATVEVYDNRPMARVTLLTTGDLNSVTIGAKQTTTSDIIVEVVEFRNGQARLQHKGIAMLGLKWQYQSLGSVRLEDNALIAENDGYSVAEVTYSTNKVAWQVSNYKPELTQFLITE